MKRRQEDEERRRAEELAAQEAALSALHSPPDESRTDQYVLHFMSFQVQQLKVFFLTGPMMIHRPQIPHAPAGEADMAPHCVPG